MNINDKSAFDAPLGDAELAFLDEVLHKYGNDEAILNASELDGFLTAIVSGPDMIAPSRWLPALWGSAGSEPDWQSKEEMQRFMALLFQLVNHNATTLMEAPEQFRALFQWQEHKGQEQCIVERWCYGYMRGLALGDWRALPEAERVWRNIIALHGCEENLTSLQRLSAEEYQKTLAIIEPAARKLHRYWLSQRTPQGTVSRQHPK